MISPLDNLGAIEHKRIALRCMEKNIPVPEPPCMAHEFLLQ